MVVDPRHDHSLRVPRPDLSVALGVPNACNACHARKGAAWAEAAVRKWYGHRPEGLQRFALTLARGSSADLAALAADPAQPEIARATALQRLARQPSREGVEAIRAGLEKSDPLMRLGALQALRPLPPEARFALGRPLLGDTLLAVRVEAASIVAGTPGSEPLPEFQRAAAEFVRVQKLNADRPEARTTLGAFYAARGMAADAEAVLRSAIAMAPDFAPGYVNLADLFRAQGREADALAALDAGLAKAPGAAALHYARGLALVRLKRRPEALHELRRAAQLAPREARFAYVYAIGLHDAGRTREALAEIDRALVVNPDDADLLGARKAYAGR